MTLSAPAAAEEDLARELCGSGALGVEVDPGAPPAPGRILMRAYFESGRPLPDAAAVLRACPLAAGAGILSVEPLEDGRWVERWIETLAPFDVGESFRIVPVADADDPGAAPPAESEGRIPLRILPGRAFGTGEHATTRLCLEALERSGPRGRSVLDVGTGSGILAIAARALGARRVAGFDVDPEAIRVARANSLLNPGGDAIELACGSPEGTGERFDIVLANLNSGILEDLLPRLAGCVAGGGSLVLSGLLEGEVESMAALAARLGLPLLERNVREGWACTRHGMKGA